MEYPIGTRAVTFMKRFGIENQLTYNTHKCTKQGDGRVVELFRFPILFVYNNRINTHTNRESYCTFLFSTN
jgi:hypothetical protein